MNKDILNVLYQSDDNYAAVSAISIASLLENNKHLKQINIFYLGHKLKKGSINKFNEMVGSYKNATITFVDVSGYPDELKEIGVKAWKGLYITWYKMLAFAKLDIKTDRILYINPHTVISGALDGLLELDFEDNILALSYDATMVNAHKDAIGLKSTDGYFNCGIMLVNHKKWMKDKIDSKMREHLRHNHYEVADQDLCNVFFKDKIKLVGVEYNFSTVFYGYDIKKYIKANGFMSESFYSYNEIMEAYYAPKIVHSQFGITGRPWQVGNDNPVGLLWRKYLEMTPWKDAKMPEAKKDINWRLYKLLPQAIVVKLYAWAVKRKFAK